MGEPVRDWEKIREALPVVLGESLAVGDWLGASDAPAPVIAAQERVAAAVQELGVLLSALAQARARNEELREALQLAEWNGSAWVGLYTCPVCGSEEPKHASDCQLADALAAAAEPSGSER